MWPVNAVANDVRVTGCECYPATHVSDVDGGPAAAAVLTELCDAVWPVHVVANDVRVKVCECSPAIACLMRAVVLLLCARCLV